ncbi:MAG TPA: Crp/Fnr family transcriptional regulator [Pyrinomonadaceae bacterium]|jgi:CRP-like cAMP-binding protein|nr:Crp/Fnr family transcriptional regulator [Pyrinomonadaceae bacterium]
MDKNCLMHTQPVPHSENHILAHLPPADYERLRPHLEQVKLPTGKILHEAGELIEHVYFPQHSMISLISQTAEGENVEVGVVGYEGMAGISVVLGVDKSPHQALVQYPDGALRLKTQVLRAEFKRAGALHELLLRFTQGLLLQTSQVAACNRLHTVAERLARWILMSQDRCQCDDLPFTHEFLALMLGVRRAGVTEAAIILQAEGYISYRRGHIHIDDGEGLKAFTCSCYQIIKAEFDLMTA